MSEQTEIKGVETSETRVDTFKFDKPNPIKGYPELHWQGKKPFRYTQYYPAQLKETHGELKDGWMNKLFWGDNLQVMSHLLKEFRGRVDLIYIDPPYDSKADYKMKISLRGMRITSDHMAFEEKQYADIWTSDQYLQFMYERLILLRELLSDKGSIYIHADDHKVHHLRMIADEIFGPSFHRNDIVWHYFMGGKPKRFFARKHDTILFYTKGSDYTFNEQYHKRILPYKPGLGSNEELEQIKCKACNGDSGVYLSTVKMDDVWDISGVFNMSNEFTDYPTQKPIALLERIITASSNPGDVVFDCFMGSGTTLVTAMRLGRKFIGADINLGAVQLTTKRLIEMSNTQYDVEYVGRQAGFEIYNVNNYDVFRNPIQAKELLVKALEVQPLPSGSIWDGERDGKMVKVMPVNRIACKADLEELRLVFGDPSLEKRSAENPTKAVLDIELVCMGHEPGLAVELQKMAHPIKINVDVVDILKGRDLQFKRDSEAHVVVEKGKLVIKSFYPMNLLSKLSMEKTMIGDWRELVDSIMIDFNYDGAVLNPTVVDIPDDKNIVEGVYPITADHGHIRIKITDLLSESIELDVEA